MPPRNRRSYDRGVGAGRGGLGAGWTPECWLFRHCQRELYSGLLPTATAADWYSAMGEQPLPVFTVEELPIPPDLLDEQDPPVADFIAMIAVHNAAEASAFGSDEFQATPAELLPLWLDQHYEPKRLFVIRIAGRIVARSVFETRPAAEGEMAWVHIQVLPEFRRRGIGTALADHLDELARGENRQSLVAYVPSGQPASTPSAVSLKSPTGFGAVPAANPEVKFLLRHGFLLEQVERVSRLPLPTDFTALHSMIARAREAAGRDYVVHRWVGATPPHWLDDMAMMFTRMSTDAPSAGLEEPEDLWTRERLIDYESKREQDPRTVLVCAIEHVASGRLVGLSELAAPPEPWRPASQHDTIVIREHRGHCLGLVLKLANLEHLADIAPGHPSITTFNAEENRHMLEVNEALGFEVVGYEGAWKKKLRTR